MLTSYLVLIKYGYIACYQLNFHNVIFLFCWVGWVDIYITAKDSTYKWDTCAGQAILTSLGGGITDLRTGNDTTYHLPLPNRSGIDQWSNVGGIVAFRTKNGLDKVHDLVQKFLETHQQHKKFAGQRSIPSEEDNWEYLRTSAFNESISKIVSSGDLVSHVDTNLSLKYACTVMEIVEVV